MAILSALFSFLLRQTGKILQALFGWSTTALFGRLPTAKQTAVQVALVLSVIWPIFVVGVFFPAAAAWVIAFLPLHKWMSESALRVLWCTLAVITPAIVGLVTHWVAPAKKGGWLNAIIHGYPLALGYAFSFLVTVVTVPLIKIASVARRWTDQHVYVQPLPEHYGDALDDLREACVAAGIEPEIADVPTSMALSTKVIRAMARGAVAPMVEEDPKMLRADGLELYLYPSDLLIRGEKAKAAHVRAMMTRTKLDRDAYLVGSDEAQKIQERVCEISKTLAQGGSREREEMRLIRGDIDQADIPFDDWSMLEHIVHHVEQEASSSPDTSSGPP